MSSVVRLLVGPHEKQGKNYGLVRSIRIDQGELANLGRKWDGVKELVRSPFDDLMEHKALSAALCTSTVVKCLSVLARVATKNVAARPMPTFARSLANCCRTFGVKPCLPSLRTIPRFWCRA